ncbi:hypothetical protein RRG08_018589 [Elysia crispata]|uniref:Uncharacterized protein n=1 Tax=Elysia crispata TaxID=231223 RepID=A0AAE1A754_9GAST|nr:hypothetical protein RRG08_018589 [Elysia crispata]
MLKFTQCSNQNQTYRAERSYHLLRNVNYRGSPILSQQVSLQKENILIAEAETTAATDQLNLRLIEWKQKPREKCVSQSSSARRKVQQL